jgi:cyclic-di-GMP phosphodiesterase TipF (flagellum assembly factor)
MRRISAIFIAVCMVLIAGSLGAVLFLGLGLDGRSAAIVALAALVAMALYNTISNRLRDRTDLGDQIADLSRGTADLARQVAELGRRLNGVEARVESTVTRTRGADDPIAAEIGELGGLVRQIADTVAAHEAALAQRAPLATRAAAPVMPAHDFAPPPAAVAAASPAPPPAAMDAPLALSESDAVNRFQGLSREHISELIGRAADANRIDLYLQPIVTLPQRKVRYYEALSRLRTDEGEIIPAGEFIDYAEAFGLMPKIDNLLLFRCVQVTRRLQMKSRDVGVFCNISGSTLTDAAHFKQLLDFMDANRALAGALTFEFTQEAYRSFGPMENEGLSALAERGFRFSMDHVTDLRMEPKELADRWFRFLKVPAKLLLNKAATAQSDIHPEDLADLLARSGIDLIAERIENENMVVDLLEYDVRFGQGFLFSAPRPVRAEALQGGEGDKSPGESVNEFAGVGASI